MPPAARSIVQHDPSAAFAEGYPSWTFDVQHDLGRSYRISRSRRRVVFDQTTWARDADMALAHATAVLDLELGLDGPLSPEQLAQAAWLARVRLDRQPSN